MSAPVLKGSLTDAPGYLPDALQLSALTPFVPENVVLGRIHVSPLGAHRPRKRGRAARGRRGPWRRAREHERAG